MSITAPPETTGNGRSDSNGSGRGARLAGVLAFEPLARMSDYEEYRAAYQRYKSGEWDAERWTAFRLRFGIYGQLQPGVQMIRIKIPGGILPFDHARAVARLNDEFAGGHKQIHVTTRQDVQLYFVPLDDTPEFVRELYGAGLTTREACGNTLRNMNGCMLAGVCPREHVDAGKVAEQIAHMWLRQPLVQHMPRKFKVSVSGCETDCAASGIHDMGLVATVRDGKKGFVLFGGGGTGGVAISAVKLLDFVTEFEVGAALEALVRLHQRYSNRINRNQARIKFLIKRFGEEKFRALFLEEFERVRALPQRPWQPLEWRDASEAPEPASPGGVVYGHDGRVAIVVNPPLGLLTSAQLTALADLAEDAGAEGLRATREQNIVIVGLPRGAEDGVAAAVRALGLPVQERDGDIPDVVSCPGTTTCRLGITNSQNFGKEVGEIVRGYQPLPGVSVKISGCQNGCGLHHIADFGFRGMGKKIEGVNAPHYQIYVGGNGRINGAIGISGPIVPARYAPEALKLFMDAYASGRRDGESVRDWATRLGKDGLKEIVKDVTGRPAAGDKQVFVDWGESEHFHTPEAAHAECAAPFAIDNLLRDLADDGLIGLDRAMLAEKPIQGLHFGREGFYYAARRLLLRGGVAAGEAGFDETIAQLRALYAGDAHVAPALERVSAADAEASQGRDFDQFRERLAEFIDLAAELAARPFEAAAFDAAALGDSSGTVAAMLRAQGAAE
jgi:sulfite reductase (NADPH) hemoprotein beta-component